MCGNIATEFAAPGWEARPVPVRHTRSFKGEPAPPAHGMRVAALFRRKQHADVGGKKPAKAEPGKRWYRAGCRSGRARPLRTLLTNTC